MVDEKKTKQVTLPVHTEPPAVAPPFYILGSTFVAQTPFGELTIPLKVKTSMIEDHLVNLNDTDQVYAILRANDQEADVDNIRDMDDAVETQVLVRMYWKAYAQRQETRLGEAFGSSGS